MAEMMIRRVGVFSVAKMYGLLTFFVGLIIGVLYGLFFILMGATMSQFGPRGQQMSGAAPVVIGLIIMVAVPVFYGILGFVAGAIGGFIYNIAAGVVGGIKVDVEPTGPQYAPPPPPQQWGAANPYQQ
jgi:hypothetical protein